MKEKHVLPVGEFAEISRTTRDTLLYYDKIGLLRPVSRHGNGYRYYSHRQLPLLKAIRTLQAFGMTLAEIRERTSRRTPEDTEELIDRQVVKIDEEVEKWLRARKLMLTLKKSIRSVAGIDETSISLHSFPEERIFLGGTNDYSRGADAYDALGVFYRDMTRRYPGLDLNYPVWGFFTGERILSGDWAGPDRYYFANPDGPDVKPAGRYAVAYGRGDYGSAGEVYGRLLAYLEERGLTPRGNVYEEYPLNEHFVSECDSYLIRVMIEV